MDDAGGGGPRAVPRPGPRAGRPELQSGRVLVEGPYAEIRHDPRVISAYLGDANA
ncbi:hypothetical protein AB0B89_18110, partial [Sphaerisporangium sp. NPDC049002]